MKYYIKRVLAPGSMVFKIDDCTGSGIYTVEAVFPVSAYKPNRAYRYNINGFSVAVVKITRLPIPNGSAYSVYCPQKSFQLVLTGGCKIYGTNLYVRGDVFSLNYDFADSSTNSAVAAVTCSGAVAGAVELDVFDERRRMECISAAVCLNLAQKVDKLSVQPV